MGYMNEEKKRFSNLEGERIELIKVNKQGLDDMHEYSKNPKFYKYMEYDVFKSRNETRKYLNRIIELTNSGSDYFWFIKLKSEKKNIGTIAIRDINQWRNSAYLGYGLSPNYWKKGYFSESLKLVLNHLFSDLDFHRISIKTQDTNNSSIKAVIKAGFKKEGILRESLRSSKNKRINEVIFGMLKKEFLKKYGN
jgi:[ribosomal protein S5]-alanine N-acetyltransferase